MKSRRLNSVLKRTSPLPFYLLVLILSAFFWGMGPVVERFLAGDAPVNLPLSSLMTVCPISAALILVQRENGWEGVKKLLKRSFDVRIRSKIWYVPILLLMPAIVVLQQGWASPTRSPIPGPRLPAFMVPVWVGIFLIAALGEEVGWQGYAIDRLQGRWNALIASVVLGMGWATWHIVPLIQLERTPMQIVWQCMDMVATRILIVWLYHNTGKSVFAAVVYHAMYNVSTLLLPNYGLRYDPMMTSVLVAIAAAIVTFLWGPKTLARYRYARSDPDVGSRAGTLEPG